MYQILSVMGKIEVHGNDPTETLPKVDFDKRPLPMGTKAYVIDSTNKAIVTSVYDAENENWIELS